MCNFLLYFVYLLSSFLRSSVFILVRLILLLLALNLLFLLLLLIFFFTYSSANVPFRRHYTYSSILHSSFSFHSHFPSEFSFLSSTPLAIQYIIYILDAVSLLITCSPGTWYITSTYLTVFPVIIFQAFISFLHKFRLKRNIFHHIKHDLKFLILLFVFPPFCV